MQRLGYYAVGLLLLCITMFVACQKKENFVQFAGSYNAYIQNNTAIHIDQSIRIVFNYDIVSSNTLENLEDTIIIKPYVSMQAQFVENNIIELRPDTLLKANTDYTVTIRSEFFQNQNIDDIVLDFQTSMFTVVSIDYTMNNDETQPENVHMQAHIRMNQTSDISLIQKSLTITDMDNNQIPFILNSDARDKKERATDFIVTASIARAKNDARTFFIRMKHKQLLGIYEKSLSLQGSNYFGVDEHGLQNNVFYIKMNKFIAVQQDVKQYITIEPFVAHEMSIDNDFIHISGQFNSDTQYTVQLLSGFTSENGQIVDSTESFIFGLQPQKPRVSIITKGSILPSRAENEIYVETVNVTGLTVEVYRVSQKNSLYFLRNNSYGNNYYVTDFMQKIGDSYRYDIAATVDKTVVTALSLQELMLDDPQAIYIIRLSFTREDMVWEFSSEYESWSEDPNSPGYLYSYGTTQTMIRMSDVVPVVRIADNQIWVHTRNVVANRPESAVTVQMYSQDNELLAQSVSDAQGMAFFGTHIKPFITKEDIAHVKFIELHYNKQSSLFNIFSSNNNNDMSVFDIGGLQTPHSYAFVYSDRGIYRPGSLLSFGGIIRQKKVSLPDNHPITLELYTSRGLMHQRVLIYDAKDGFFSQQFETQVTSATGVWTLLVKLGDTIIAEHTVRLETLVAPEIEVMVNNVTIEQTPYQSLFTADISAQYLFGKPAQHLESEGKIIIQKTDFFAKKHPQYVARNESMNMDISFDMSSERILLDDDGMGYLSMDISEMNTYDWNGYYTIYSTATVWQHNGYSVVKTEQSEHTLYDGYVLYQKPNVTWGYSPVNEAIVTPIIVVNAAGDFKPATVRYRIYHNERYFWWEYASKEEAQMRFKNNKITQIIQEDSISFDGNTPAQLRFIPKKPGRYFIELVYNSGDEHNMQEHIVGFFTDVWHWGEQISSIEGLLGLHVSNDEYSVGDTAEILFNSAYAGQAWITLEQENQLLKQFMAPVNEGNNTLSFPINADMVPTVYARVNIFYPYGKNTYDKPLRMQAITPIRVIDKDMSYELTIDTPQVVKPGETAHITIASTNGMPHQVSIAIVDEGLLFLDNFHSPNPYAYFTQKRALLTNAYDFYSDVIGTMTHRGLLSALHIGGSETMDAAPRLLTSNTLEKMNSDIEQSLFSEYKPVSFFSGILESDSNGVAHYSFTVPSYYQGRVRVMAVSANKNSYAQVDEQMIVRDAVKVSIGGPRYIGPLERFELPIMVYRNDSNIGSDVVVTIKTSDGLQIVSDVIMTQRFDARNEAHFVAHIETKETIAAQSVEVHIQIGEYEYKRKQPIIVSPISAQTQLFFDERYILQNQETHTFFQNQTDIKTAFPQSIQTMVRMSRREGISFERRMKQLSLYSSRLEDMISYYMGRLYQHNFINLTEKQKTDVQNDIADSFIVIQQYIGENGGLQQWPNTYKSDTWLTLYALDYLYSAQQLGYTVPSHVMKKLRTYIDNVLIRESLEQQAYGIFVLAKSSTPNYMRLNFLRENMFESASATTQIMIAATYALLGDTETAAILFTARKKSASDDIFVDKSMQMRYDAFALLLALKLENVTDTLELSRYIIANLNSKNWYSGHAIIMSLMALQEYYTVYVPEYTERMAITIRDRNGKTASLALEAGEQSSIVSDIVFTPPIRVQLQEDSQTNTVFIEATFSAVGLYPTEKENKGLDLSVQFVDINGQNIDEHAVQVGDEFYGIYTVKQTRVHDLAMMEFSQYIPAGWHVRGNEMIQENIPLPLALKKYQHIIPQYSDIRDRYISLFFDFTENKNNNTIIIPFTAVTAGSYHIGPAHVYALEQPTHYYAQTALDTKKSIVMI